MGHTHTHTTFVLVIVASCSTTLLSSHSLFLVNNGLDKMVSHISHALPGQSSMTIIRTFRGNSQAPQPGGQSSLPTLLSQPHSGSVHSLPGFSTFPSVSQPLSGQTTFYQGVQHNPSHGQIENLNVPSNSTRYPLYPNRGVIGPEFNPSPQLMDNQHAAVYTSAGSGSNYLIYPGRVPDHSQYPPVPDQHQHPLVQDPPQHAPVQGSRQFPQETAAKVPEYPLTEGPGDESVPGPFSPRFNVQKLEVDDEEAQEEIVEGFTNSGLYPGFLSVLPRGLVNFNFGFHGCVHLGTELDPNQSAKEPTRVSFPASPDKYHTVVLVDAESRALHWLLVNIPGPKVKQGNTIAVYQPPSSRLSSGSHHYVVVALEQTGAILYGLEDYSAAFCDWKNREMFDLPNFMQKFDLHLVAGNFFRSFPNQTFAEQQCNYTYI